jgi:hypothetical protein
VLSAGDTIWHSLPGFELVMNRLECARQRQTSAKFAGPGAEKRYLALAALFLIELRKCYLCRY